MIREIIVAGIASFSHFFHPIDWPLFSIVVYATTFAEAPIGVKLPPISRPNEVAQTIIDNAGTPTNLIMPCSTYAIERASGTLSITPLARPEPQVNVLNSPILLPLKRLVR